MLLKTNAASKLPVLVAAKYTAVALSYILLMNFQNSVANFYYGLDFY